jgi:hypothetical protein
MILGAVFFMIPSLVFLFSFFVNFLLVSMVYIAIYAIVLGMKTKGIFSGFVSEIRDKLLVFIAYIIVLLALVIISLSTNPLILPLLVIVWTLGLLGILLYAYSKIIEKTVFKKRIPVSALQEGDVLADHKEWRGITQEEIAQLKKHRKRFVNIKDGVRFTLVFPITIIITLLLGNILLAFIV